MTIPASKTSRAGRKRDFWADLDDYELSESGVETVEEARAYDARVKEEIKWKLGEEVAHVPVSPAVLEDLQPTDKMEQQQSQRQEDDAQQTNHPSSEAIPPAFSPFNPDTSLPVPSFHASHILRTSTPRAIPLPPPNRPRAEVISSQYPSVPTPSDDRPSLPAPIPHSPARNTRSSKSSAVESPVYIASPVDTPTTSSASSGPKLSYAGISEGRGRRDDPSTPVPLGRTNLSNSKTTKDLQAVTKHFELFAKSLAKGKGLVVDASTSNGGKLQEKGKGRKGIHPNLSVASAQGLGGKVFDGLRFCMPPEVNQVAKHKQRWEIISKLGGQVTLQPDTAITHVIYDAGRSASLLAQRLGLQALSELPEGTVCVKWEWVVQCKMAGTLLDPAPWLSFPKTSFSRTVSANAVRPTSRMFDITDRLRAQSVSISRKREPTPPDSDTEESSKKRSRANATRSAILFPVSELDAGPSVHPQMTVLKAGKGKDSIATDHEVSDGRRWVKAASEERDALDDMIDGVRDGNVQEIGGEGDGSEDEPETTSNANASGLLKSKSRLRPENFKCGQKSDGTSNSPNEWLAKKFEALHDVYQGQVGKSAFAIRGYQRAAGIMRRIDYPITTGAQARVIPGIGASLADRIDEFLSGAQGRAFYEDTEQARCIALFKDIYGVGRHLANKLYQLGARSISDLRLSPSTYGLTSGQKIGLDLYDDLNSRIPREECKALLGEIQAQAKDVDERLWVEIMGSYRRGQEDSGDVDILITRDTEDGRNHQGMLKSLVKELKGKGIITHDLSIPHDWDALEAKWMGVGRLGPGSKYRRIDILCIPFEQWGAALIYFTGNEVFNRSLRLYARKLGYSLNQRGLSKGVIRGKDGLKTTEGEIIASRTEQEIFDVLGIRWRHPHHRRP